MGIATVLETFYEPTVLEAAQRLLPVLNVSGPVAMEFCVDLAIQAGFNLPLVEFNYAIGESLPQLEGWQECLWFDTDKEPFAYAALCLKELTLRPHGKKPVLPYHGNERFAVRLAAVFEALRKLARRFGSKIR